MSLFWPLISLGLAVIAFFLSRRADDARNEGPAELVRRVVALILLVILSAAAAWKFGPLREGTPLFFGLIAGVVLAAAASFAGRPRPEALLTSIGFGVAAASSTHLLAVPFQSDAQFGVLFGVGLSALVFAVPAASVSALAAALVIAADYLGGRHSPAAVAPLLGTLIGIFVVLGGILAASLGGRMHVIRGLVVGAVVAAAGYWATHAMNDRNLSTSLLVGLGAAIVIDWLLPSAEPSRLRRTGTAFDSGDPAPALICPDAVRIGLAAVIGIGVATLTFGLAKGAGMALALAAGGGLLLAVGNSTAVLALGPLFGLTLFRVLAEAHPAASHALDLGQHYALLGLTLGAVLPLVPLDWLARTGVRGVAGAALWGLMPLAVPPLVFVMFGDKGVIGFVVGVGFSGVCQAMRGGTNLLPLGIAGGMAASTILSMNWMTGTGEMSRGDKVHILEWAAAAILAVAIVLTLLSRAPTPPTEAAQPSAS